MHPLQYDVKLSPMMWVSWVLLLLVVCIILAWVATSRAELRRVEQTAQKAIRRAEQRAQEAEVRVKRAYERVQDSERIRRRAEQRAQEAEVRVQRAYEDSQEAEERAVERAREAERTADERVQESETRMREAARRAEQSNQRAQEADGRVRRAEQRAVEAEERAERHWVVESAEIHITGEKLGKGGWGEVKVAEFRGTKVAAKFLYDELQYAVYHDLFVREMNMAARIRHPNLVQFIGATLGGRMVILMELMPLSLRCYLEKYCYSNNFTSTVSLDITKGLNYLHQMQPDSIIHRDISSANILLEPLINHQWRAKITDYGSANFQQKVKTAHPGASVYEAPEARDPSLQSSKMDIFSFGILLLEMCTKFSDFSDIAVRKRLIDSIENWQWKELVRRCIHKKKHMRPTAAEIIVEITTTQ